MSRRPRFRSDRPAKLGHRRRDRRRPAQALAGRLDAAHRRHARSMVGDESEYARALSRASPSWCDRARSDVDLSPFRLVADAFLCGRRDRSSQPFDEDEQRMTVEDHGEPDHDMRNRCCARSPRVACLSAPALRRRPTPAGLGHDRRRPARARRIEPAIYGQFAEHLGRGIYEGIWVGEDSPIPNTRGYRNDVVAALQELARPGRALAGRLLRRRISLARRHRPARKRPARSTRTGAA